MDSQRSTFSFGKQEDLANCPVVNGILLRTPKRGKMPRLRGLVLARGEARCLAYKRTPNPFPT